MNVTGLTNVFFTLLILATTVLSVANRRACEASYKSFVRKHVLQKDFDRNSVTEWQSYLEAMQLCRMKNGMLCYRTPTQSFIEPDQKVEDICTDGVRVANSDNLCISTSQMCFYDVIAVTDNNNKCTIKVKKRCTYVVVACEKIGNRRLPIHFERYTNQTPTSDRC